MNLLILEINLFEILFANSASLTLFVIFLIVFVFGTFLIYSQVALVLKGEFKLKDRLQCIIFGIIFSLAVMIVIGMAFIFTVETPEFWVNSAYPAPEIHPIALLIPFIICLAYISFYPLIDFLFIALSKESDEGLTPFHKFIGEKIINISNSKHFSVILAISFYFLVFFLPPIFFSFFLGLPFLIIWISWMLIYPLMILTFYGSKGYIAGITNVYYNIPDLSRSMFLGFENGKRTMKEFLADPVPRILLGLMLFVFVWAWISAVQTIAYYFSGTLAISPYSYAGMVFVTLLFGIIGYFTRFWGRKIKFRGIDIYFAAYLMAAVGINVLVNFLIVNSEKLFNTFNFVNLTNEMTPNYLMFAFAAAIEEIILIIFTSYYFLTKKNKFTNNIKYSIITECSQKFEPLSLFNLIKNENPKIRKYAEDNLILMFERIPFKQNIDLNKDKYKNFLIDGICDPHPNSKRICYKILSRLEIDAPNIVLPWIIDALKSPNYDKSIQFARSLLEADLKLVERIPENLILNLIEDPEWRLKYIGLKLLSRLIKNNHELITNLNINKLVNDADSNIQVETLNLLAESSAVFPIDTLINKLNNSNRYIRAAAIKNLSNLKIENMDPTIISKIKALMKDPTSSVRASIFEIFAKIGHFKKFSIPILPFLDGLIDSDKNVRHSSVLALEKYFNEEPESLNIDLIIKKIDPNNNEVLNSVLSLLGRLWEKNPKKILTTLLIFIKFDNDQLKENISKTLIEKYKINPDLILKNLIKIPDVSKFITKGIISRTIINICKINPKNIIPKLINYLSSDNDDIRMNAVVSLEGLIDEFIDMINIKPFLLILQKDKNAQIKKETSKIISKIAKMDPMAIKPEISFIFQTLNNQETSVKIVFSKSILEIAKVSPEIIPVASVIKFFSDQDSFIRESGAKILGFIGYKAPEESINILINKGLIDKDWIVRDATVSSLGRIVNNIENKELIINKLVSLLDDEQVWVRRSSINILSNIKGIKASQIPFEQVLNNLENNDPKVREASAGLLKIYSFQNIDRIFDNILILLADDSEDVRNSMINTMVEIIQKIGLSNILSKLLKNLSDESSIEAQRSISLILGRTASYEQEKIKKRIISLLKIRCEMSQDPIICETLHKLSES